MYPCHVKTRTDKKGGLLEQYVLDNEKNYVVGLKVSAKTAPVAIRFVMADFADKLGRKEFLTKQDGKAWVVGEIKKKRSAG